MYKGSKKIFFIFLLVIFQFKNVVAQRIYASNSVLSAGNWYKIGVRDAGIYKIDLSFLNKLGVTTTNIPSNSVRVFGNHGNMLSESNAGIPVDDLLENSLHIVDGGDGILNGPDYILFYAGGPHRWLKDSINKRFIHEKNLFSDTSFYFLSIGGVGKQIQVSQVNTLPGIIVNSFNERYFHEHDSVNLLSSGKEWFGEEFANAPGKTLTRNFPLPFPGLQINQPVTVITNSIARSVGVNSRFDLRVNDQLVQQITIPATGAGIYDVFAQQVEQLVTTTSGEERISVSYTYIPGGFNAQGWLNWFEIHARKKIALDNSGQLLFRDWNSVGNNIGEFVIGNTNSNTQVWDISDPLAPVKMLTNFSGNETKFINNCNRLREYIAFNEMNAFVPVALGRIANQDLHNSQPVDYLVITHISLLSEAERLAAFHRQKNNLRVFVTTTEKIYNEFSSGAPDPTAIRDFVKMYYDKATTPADKPDYLLLFGDASFDYKNRLTNNTNFVPAYESKVSLEPLNTYTSDDFFGFLDDNEDINSGTVANLLDIGIGRIPAKNITEAKNFVDKLEAYYNKESFGPWRNQLSFVADDEDNNLHLQDAEIVTATSASVNPVFNIQKIYLDAYQQVSGSAGSRYPQVNEAINNRIYNGTLIWNYNGHGGAKRLAEEVILDQEMVNSWKNPFRLPLFVTSTCDFAPYDDPFNNSLGENLLLRPRNGGIALMTTTRLVFSFSNRVMNNNYMQFALQPDASGKFKSLGEAVRTAKNYTYQTSGDIINNRKFTLLGDPALTLGFPQFKIRTTKVNDAIIPGQTDTISATEKAIIEGEITDNSGAVISSFNGTVYTVVFDKPQTINTLANDPTSQSTGFQAQSTILFKGKSTVSNGKFSFEFKVPRDLNYQLGNGKISYYAENGITDGSDFFTGFIVGGSGSQTDTDDEGPVLKAWLNDEKFVNGSISNETPVLILKLSDSSGINTAGTGIGHDITVTIDNDNNKLFVLNDYYEAELDSYKQGIVRFQLPVFEPGLHTIKIKAWDVLNNSNEIFLDFTIVNDDDLVIDHVLNYPNPFTTKTQFWFEHNKPGQDLFVQLHIYSLTGRVIKTIQKTINTIGNRSIELEWDGRDEFGDKVGRGVYFYQLKVQYYGLKPKTVIEKLVVF